MKKFNEFYESTLNESSFLRSLEAFDFSQKDIKDIHTKMGLKHDAKVSLSKLTKAGVIKELRKNNNFAIAKDPKTKDWFIVGYRYARLDGKGDFLIMHSDGSIDNIVETALSKKLPKGRWEFYVSDEPWVSLSTKFDRSSRKQVENDKKEWLDDYNKFFRQLNKFLIKRAKSELPLIRQRMIDAMDSDDDSQSLDKIKEYKQLVQDIAENGVDSTKLGRKLDPWGFGQTKGRIINYIGGFTGFNSSNMNMDKFIEFAKTREGAKKMIDKVIDRIF